MKIIAGRDARPEVDWSSASPDEAAAEGLGRALVMALDAQRPSANGIRRLDVVILELEKAIRDYYARS